MTDVFLLLGSNLGDRERYLERAAELIAQQVAPVVKSSSVYQTQAWGKTDEPDYLNQVLQVQTDLTAEEVLTRTLAIEQQLGRVRAERWGSRIIDIDLLFYGQDVIDTPDLQVPHPRLHERRFTLEPLAEIAPDLQHPILKVSASELKSLLKDDLIIKKL